MTGQKISTQPVREFEPTPRGERLNCFWSTPANVSILRTDARLMYSETNHICKNCKACQDHNATP